MQKRLPSQEKSGCWAQQACKGVPPERSGRNSKAEQDSISLLHASIQQRVALRTQLKQMQTPIISKAGHDTALHPTDRLWGLGFRGLSTDCSGLRCLGPHPHAAAKYSRPARCTWSTWDSAWMPRSSVQETFDLKCQRKPQA